jgi:dynein heavy chain
MPFFEEKVGLPTPQGLSELRTFSNPPQRVKNVMATIAILFGVPTDWKSIMSYTSENPRMFIKNLENFDKTKVSKETIDKLKPYVEDPNFNPQQMLNFNETSSLLCRFTLDVYNHATNKLNQNEPD